MAIARGAGTEIIRSIHAIDLDSTAQTLIFGVQHHIYTVLSISIYANVVQASGNYLQVGVTGYDSKAGTTAQTAWIFKQEFSAGETFVWNDKFSFNGYEPTDFSGAMNDATKQDAIADQGSSVTQFLKCNSEHASDNFHITCSFIDQNNA